jgi:hypothetical protein
MLAQRPPGVPPIVWEAAIYDAALLFGDWGSELARLGWQANDLFAVPRTGTRGGLLWFIKGSPVVAIGQTAAFVQDGRLYRRHGQAGMSSNDNLRLRENRGASTQVVRNEITDLRLFRYGSGRAEVTTNLNISSPFSDCSASAPSRQIWRFEGGRISSLFGRLRSSNFRVFAEKISLADPRFSIRPTEVKQFPGVCRKDITRGSSLLYSAD